MHLIWGLTETVAISFALLTSGCGTANKWITVVNDPSGIQITSRYVTSTKSVIVKSKPDVVKLFMKLPDSIPRVSRNKVGHLAKAYDFKGVLSNKYKTWIQTVSSSRSDAATETCPSINKIIKGKSVADIAVSVKLEQDSKGDLYMSIWEGTPASETEENLDPEQSLVSLRTKAGGAALCISAWAPDETIMKVVGLLFSMKDGYIKLLTENQRGEGYKLGSRLKRSTEPIKPELPDDDPQESTKA